MRKGALPVPAILGKLPGHVPNEACPVQTPALCPDRTKYRLSSRPVLLYANQYVVLGANVVEVTAALFHPAPRTAVEGE